MVAANDPSVAVRLMTVVKARRIAAVLRPDRVHLVPADKASPVPRVVSGFELLGRHTPPRALEPFLPLPLIGSLAIPLELVY